MKKITKIALASAALCAAADAAANVPTHTQSYTSNTLAFTKSNSGVLDLTKFNTALGTLQSVQIQLFSDLGTTIKVENKSQNSISTITGTAGVGLTLTGATVNQTLATSGTHVFNEAKFDTVDNFAGASGAVYTFSLAPFSSSNTYTGASTLAAFSTAGLGTVHLTLAGLTNSSVSGTSGNTHSLVLPSYDAYATVTYTYATPVPEPETYAMLLAGLGLVGAIARKRKAK